MKIVGVGDQLTIDALRLMGIAGTVVTTAEEASRALDEALEAETVVLIAAETAELVREKVEEAKTGKQAFIVLELPSVGGEAVQSEKTAKLLSQAIGIRI